MSDINDGWNPCPVCRWHVYYGEPHPHCDVEELSHALSCLRVLTGPVCRHCWDIEGLVTVATVESVPYYGDNEWFCESCYDSACEGAWERHCESFYSGSAPYTQEEQYQAACAEKRRLG